MIENQDIICISISDWQKPWGSRQQLMSGLSQKNRILYVEYQVSFLHISLYGWKFNRLLKGSLLRKINENLFVLTPYPSLPFRYYFRAINVINQKILLCLLKRTVRKIGFKKPLLWIYSPSAVDLIDEIDAKLILYHCIADFPAEKKNSLRKRTLSLMEEELVQKSAVVLAFSRALYKRFKAFNDSTYLFPSAVDGVLFSVERCSDMPEPLDMLNLKRPRLGVIGYLDGRVLDIELLCHVADTYQQWSVVLIGPKFRNTDNFEDLNKRNNIYFLGEKRHEDIPGYVKSLDVCMIPYRVNEFTNNISPLKLYEYMALGKPVVSTNLANLADFKNLIRISDTKQRFVRDIELSLKEENDVLLQRRLDAVKENDWGSRLEFVSRLIEKNLNRGLT